MTKFKHQKDPSKGGHHLGLFDPITLLLDTGEAPEARPTSHKLGPAGYRGCYALKFPFKVEVILILITVKESH